MAAGTYNFSENEAKDKAVYKLYIVWKKSSARYQNCIKPENKGKGTVSFYGYYKKADNGLKKLEQLFKKYEQEIYIANIYKAPFLFKQEPYIILKK